MNTIKSYRAVLSHIEKAENILVRIRNSKTAPVGSNAVNIQISTLQAQRTTIELDMQSLINEPYPVHQSPYGIHYSDGSFLENPDELAKHRRAI